MIPMIPERDKCDNVIIYKYLSIFYSIKNVTTFSRRKCLYHIVWVPT